MKTQKIISKIEFEKRIEIEFEFLVYFESMRKNDAWEKAIQIISSEYSIEN